MAAETTAIGNIISDIELRYTTAGKAFAAVTIAVNDRRRNRDTGEMEDGPTWFARGTVWGDMATNAAATLSKGMRAIGHGRIRQRDYETQDGQKRTSVEVEWDALGPDLRWAQAQVQRNQRQDNQGGVGGFGSQSQGQGSWAQSNTQHDSGFGSFQDEEPF